MRTISVIKSISKLNTKISKNSELENTSIGDVKKILLCLMIAYYNTIFKDKSSENNALMHIVNVSCEEQIQGRFWIEFELTSGNEPIKPFSIQVHELEGMELVFGKDCVYCLDYMHGTKAPFLFNFTL